MMSSSWKQKTFQAVQAKQGPIHTGRKSFEMACNVDTPRREEPVTEGNFGRCGKLHTLDWLFFSGLRSVPEFTFGA